MRARFFALVSAVLFADLASKVWALRALAGGAQTVVPHRFGFVLAHNPHGAMGLLRELPGDARRAVLVAIATLASIGVVLVARRTRPEQRVLRAGLALVLGGALGNLIDRIFTGTVVDFVDVVYWTTREGVARHWHTFNVADVAIVVGAALIAVAAHERPRPAAAR